MAEYVDAGVVKGGGGVLNAGGTAYARGAVVVFIGGRFWFYITTISNTFVKFRQFPAHLNNWKKRTVREGYCEAASYEGGIGCIASYATNSVFRYIELCDFSAGKILVARREKCN